MSDANSDAPVLLDVDDRGVARVTLNRPAVNNAYNGELVQALLCSLDELERRTDLRAVVIAGRGRHFQAGADLKWIDSIRKSTAAENVSASRATADVMRRLNGLPHPTLALVHGGCFGGGTGLASSCDIVIAADNAMFSIAEVRWGLAAQVIIPQLNDAIGVRQVRRYALTGERFGADEARRIGLVHEVVALDELEAAGEKIIGHLLENAPEGIVQTKATAVESSWGDLTSAQFMRLVRQHAAKRQSAEAKEGLASFAEKRSANWSGQKN